MAQEDYEASKASQPDFYRAGDSLQYGVAPKLPERNVELMVAELNQQRAKKQAYSRRRVSRSQTDAPWHLPSILCMN